MLTSDQKRELIEQAAQVRERAHAPYSNYQVGAALLGKSGRVYLGVNVENASYSHTICAEQNAVFSAVTAGEREFVALALALKGGEGTPCGGCRQVLSEFSSGFSDLFVLIADETGKLVSETTLEVLYPQAFDAQNL